MQTKQNSSGFHVVEVILVVAIAAVFGFIGWRVYVAQDTKSATVNTQGQPQEAPTINATSDLNEATATIDKIDLDDSDQELSDMQGELNSL